MAHQPPCIEWATKLALRQEELSPADRTALEAHVNSCPACRAAQADYHFLIARIRALPVPTVRPFTRLPEFVNDKKDREGETEEQSTIVLLRPRSSQQVDADAIGPLKRSVNSILTGLSVASLLFVAVLLFGVLHSTNSHNTSLIITNLLTYNGHSNSVLAVAWSPDGSRLASAGDDGTVQVWNASTGNNILTYRGHSNSVFAVAWSPDGSRLASAGDDGTVQVWNASTGNNILTYRGHSNSVLAVAWSPDGSRLASAGYDSTVRVWNASTGSDILIYRGHSGSVSDLAWSPDGRYIASTGYDNMVRVWNTSTGSDILIYRGHSNSVLAVAWSPDGSRLASAGNDGTMRVWNASTGKNILTYKGHSNSLSGLAWSHDGKRIALIDQNIVHVLNISDKGGT